MISFHSIEATFTILALYSWGSGANPWGKEKEEGSFVKPTHYDGLLEIVGVTSIVHLGQITTSFSSGIRVAQGTHVSQPNRRLRNFLPTSFLYNIDKNSDLGGTPGAN